MPLRRDAKVELLKKVPLFADCSKAELRELAKSADEIDLREGTVMTREGRRGREFFVLIEGSASVTRKGEKLADLTGGDWFGEIALITDRPRTATVTATSAVALQLNNHPPFPASSEGVPLATTRPSSMTYT